mmetsp:Transcript_94699/g.203346  ORF Transcript_94699/g.203346 Transcript_94699/m.203346 type:complete len:486 (+) Transcript_94699:122-1579(+)
MVQLEPDQSVLVLQLKELSAQPNVFQAHAQASLRVLDRRRRRAAQRRSVVEPPSAQGGIQGGQALAGLPTEAAGSNPELVGMTVGEVAGEAPVSVMRRRQSLTKLPSELVLADGLREPLPLKEVISEPDLNWGNTTSCWSQEIRDLLRPAGHQELGDFPSRRRCPSPDLAAVQGLQLRIGAHQIPHPRKAESGGEDSFFICPQGSAAGVADGVGEWECRFKVNPRKFADELMAGAAASTAASWSQGQEMAEARAASALSESYNATKASGSSTALIVAINAQGSQVGVANLGDSGFRQLRRAPAQQRMRVVNRTTDQQHSFNCPYQLSRLPEPSEFPSLISKGKMALVKAVQRMLTLGSKQDAPSDADVCSFPIKEGDLLILGTDGLFDNLHDTEICEIAQLAVSPFEAHLWEEGQSLDPEDGRTVGQGFTDPSDIAAAIAKAARDRAKDEHAKTPFSLSAKKASFLHRGGKLDDITVLAAWAVRA